MKVLTLVGGISQGSLNKKLFLTLKEMAEPSLDLQFQEIANLPFFSQDLENDPPAVVREYQKNIEEAKAYLFVTPEYNRSLPGVLKNAIDWASRPPDKNRWQKKPAAIVGASSGNIGTFSAQAHLRTVLNHLNVHVMSQPEFYLNASKSFDEKGKLQDDKQRKFFATYLEAANQWYKSHT